MKFFIFQFFQFKKPDYIIGPTPDYIIGPSQNDYCTFFRIFRTQHAMLLSKFRLRNLSYIACIKGQQIGFGTPC